MTPAQQKAYYAKNKADAKVKEDKALYELTGSRGDAARKGMGEGRMDAMGTAYKKGGKVMKKMKRYEDGGEIESAQGQNKNIGDDVRTRAMAAMEKSSSDVPVATPKKATPKATPKAEAKPTPKAEAPKEEKSFLKGTKGYKNFGALFKSMRESAGINSYKSGGKVSSASKRADGCAIRGKTRA